MSNGRTGRVYYEAPGEPVDGTKDISGAISIEESEMITVVRVRSEHYEYVIPWDRVVSIQYK